MRILYFLLGVLFVAFMLIWATGDMDYGPLRSELSSWAKNQIDTEFSYFKDKKFTKQDINKDYKALTSLSTNKILRFQIIDGKIYSNYDDLDLSDSNMVTAYNSYLKFFHHIVDSHEFEDNTDFLISVDDAITFPKDFIPSVPLIVPVKKEGDVLGKYMILVPDHYIIDEWPRLYNDILQANKKFVWDKKIERAFWRGRSTGGVYTRSNWQDFPRVKLVELSSEYPALLDAKFTLLAQRDKEVVDSIAARYPIAIAVSQADHVKYKMQISIEGSITSLSSELWRLLSNSIMLRQKSTNMKWFHSLFRDGEHYISVEYDMSNLIEKIKWVLANDKKAQQIAENASNVVKKEVTPDHIRQYWTKVLNEYVKHQDFDLKTPTLDEAK